MSKKSDPGLPGLVGTLKSFVPFVPDGTSLPELTPVPIVIGTLLGITFAASSLYLALKVGITVSASIPAAVLSITLFRVFSKMVKARRSSILENNIVQTIGSGGESIAFGIASTMPALLILGHDMQMGQIVVVALLGGMLGILMMIPLRNTLIVREHERLVYPEGTACAEVLIAGEKGGTTAKMVFSGFGIGLLYKLLNVGAKLWNEVPERLLSVLPGATLSVEVSPELLGVGYLIGTRTACITAAGGILASWLLAPMIQFFGGRLTEPLFPATKLISQMTPHEIWRNYILYIGAGAVAFGGLVSLARSLPLILASVKASLSRFSVDKGKGCRRTERDVPMPYVLAGALVIIALISLYRPLHMSPLGALLIVAFGFLFVTVSSRLCGEIGSSSNPISGMTVATLLITSLIFLSLGWVDSQSQVAALCVAAIVCVASANGGNTSQDLKTGFLLGATPVRQQIGLLIGAVASALVIGLTLQVLNFGSTVYSKKNAPHGVVVPNVASLTKMEKLRGPEAKSDPGTYHVLQLPHPPATGPLSRLTPGKYLVDDAGVVQYLVDPGINGVLRQRDSGTTVTKYEAPKARLMSLIIDGILARKLPWGLVLLGAAISLVLELCSVSSLAFAVGVYLPMSTTMPMLVGGMVRWVASLFGRRRGVAEVGLAEEETGSGVLYSSGLIAGGAICGILVAFMSLKEEWVQTFGFGKALGLAENNVVATVVFVLLALSLFWAAKRKEAVLSR